MSEHVLCIKLRIRLIERLAEIDLPGFIIEQLDEMLSELTYFKLINLRDNKDAFCLYLQDTAKNYSTVMLEYTTETPVSYAAHIYTPYLTDALQDAAWRPSCGLKDLLKIKQRYQVIVLLSSKEYMYRKPKKQSIIAPVIDRSPVVA